MGREAEERWEPVQHDDKEEHVCFLLQLNSFMDMFQLRACRKKQHLLKSLFISFGISLVYARLDLFLNPKEKLNEVLFSKITFKGYELRACLLNVDFYGTAYERNSPEQKLELCHQKSYASWHGIMVYLPFRIFQTVSFGTSYWFFSLTSFLSLISLFMYLLLLKAQESWQPSKKNDPFLLVISEH